MEQRCDVREVVSLNVAVYQQGQLLTHCVSGDVSRGGIFIETPHVQLSVGDSLELEVKAELEGSAASFHFHATVVHAKRSGLGLAFKNKQAQLSMALMELLSKYHARPMSLDGAAIKGDGWPHFEALKMSEEVSS